MDGPVGWRVDFDKNIVVGFSVVDKCLFISSVVRESESVDAIDVVMFSFAFVELIKGRFVGFKDVRKGWVSWLLLLVDMVSVVAFDDVAFGVVVDFISMADVVGLVVVVVVVVVTLLVAGVMARVEIVQT